MPLCFYEIFKYLKPAGYQEKYKMLYELAQVSFALSFVVLRLIIWPIKSWVFWQGSIELLSSGKAHSRLWWLLSAGQHVPHWTAVYVGLVHHPVRAAEEAQDQKGLI